MLKNGQFSFTHVSSHAETVAVKYILQPSPNLEARTTIFCDVKVFKNPETRMRVQVKILNFSERSSEIVKFAVQFRGMTPDGKRPLSTGTPGALNTRS